MLFSELHFFLLISIFSHTLALFRLTNWLYRNWSAVQSLTRTDPPDIIGFHVVLDFSRIGRLFSIRKMLAGLTLRADVYLFEAVRIVELLFFN